MRKLEDLAKDPSIRSRDVFSHINTIKVKVEYFNFAEKIATKFKLYSVGDKQCNSTANSHYTKMKNEKIISKVSEPKLMRICHLNPGMVRGLW